MPFLDSRRALAVAALLLSALLGLPSGMVLSAEPTSSPAPEVEIDLRTAVRLALERNPGLKQVEERRREVAEGILEARADAFPELALVTDWSRSRNPALLNSPDFSEFLDNFPGGEFTPREQELYRLAVEVRQALWSGGRLSAALELARVVAELVEDEIDAARLDVALEAAEAFYALRAARRSQEAVAVQVRSREENVEVIRNRLELGDVTRLELLRAESALAEIRTTLVEEEGRTRLAEVDLRSVLYLSADAPLALDEGEPALPDPVAWEEAEEIAGRLRPELSRLRLERESLVQRQEVARSEGRPQVELTGSYGREARLVDDLNDSLFQDWRVGIGMRWDFFDGFRRRSEIAKLESQSRQLEWQIAQLETEIRQEIRQALTAADTARQRWLSASAAREAAREARRVAEETYREGLSLQADLLDAQQQEVSAELVVVEATFDALTARARLERAVGRLPDGAELLDASSADPSAAPSSDDSQHPRASAVTAAQEERP